MSARIRIHVALGAVIVIAFPAFNTGADAAFLRWGSTALRTSSPAMCFNFAQSALRTLGYGSIQKTPSEVTGQKGGARVAIACFGTAPRATAVVMVISDNDSEALRARAEVVDKISKTASL